MQVLKKEKEISQKLQGKCWEDLGKAGRKKEMCKGASHRAMCGVAKKFKLTLSSSLASFTLGIASTLLPSLF